MEYLLFPKKIYNLTQAYGVNSYSHKYRKAIDVSGANIDKKIYAPFTGYVAKVYVKKNNAYTVWLVSNEKVMAADGNAYYVVMMLTHPEEIKNLQLNQKFNQNELLLMDGHTGFATGDHVDIELALYKDKNDIIVNWQKLPDNSYGLINAVDPFGYLFLSNDTILKNDIYNGQKYEIKYEKDIKIPYPLGRYKTLANMRVRTGPGLEYRQKKVKELSKDGQKNATSNNPNALALYKKGTIFDALEIISVNSNEVWAKTYSGYVNIINNEYENCKLL